MEEKKEQKKWILQCIFLIAVLVLVLQNFTQIILILKGLWKIAFPLILGAGMAYVLNILLVRLEKFYFPNSQNKIVKKSRRIVCIVISLAIITGILILIIQLVVPELLRAFGLIAEAAPVYFEKFSGWIIEYLEKFPEIETGITDWINNLSIDWEKIIQEFVNYTTSGISGILNSTFAFVIAITGGIVNFVIALIFAIYVLISKEKLLGQMKKIGRAYLKEKIFKKIENICYVADATFSSFIIGQCTEAVILGLLCIGGMLLFGFPYAAMTGVFIGVTALIPVVGAYLGAGVGAFMILTEDPMQAIFFLIFIVILQQIEGNVIYPKVVGSSIGLPGMWVLAGVTIGGGLGGIVGMLFAVPIVATMYKLVRIDVNEKLERKAQREQRIQVEQNRIERQQEKERAKGREKGK